MPSAEMTALELQAWLRARYPKEDERYEWKEWRSLKSNISGRKDIAQGARPGGKEN